MKRTFTEREMKEALEFAYCMGLNRPNETASVKSAESVKNDALSFAIAMGLNTDSNNKNNYRSQYSNNLVCNRQKALG